MNATLGKVSVGDIEGSDWLRRTRASPQLLRQLIEKYLKENGRD
jgi:hypothetical protein